MKQHIQVTKAFRHALFFSAFAAVIALGVARTAGAQPAAAVEVDIDHFQFGPAEVTIHTGDSVEWVNRDQTIHNVVSREGKFVSPGLDTGDRFSFVFDRAGDYAYLCALHPHMVGVVHVRG